MGQYSYRVTLQESLRDTNTGVMPSIEVDFIGVNESERPRWEGQDISEYFKPNNALRSNATKYTMRFTNSNTSPQVLKKSDPIWQQWMSSGSRDMIIIASIQMDNESIAVDPRRDVLTLDKSFWKSIDLIDYQINLSGVHRVTRMTVPRK